MRGDGQLVCFGINDYGECNVPADLRAVVAIAAGYSHTCAVRGDGQLSCFGLNDVQCNVPADLGPGSESEQVLIIPVCRGPMISPVAFLSRDNAKTTLFSFHRAHSTVSHPSQQIWLQKPEGA